MQSNIIFIELIKDLRKKIRGCIKTHKLAYIICNYQVSFNDSAYLPIRTTKLSAINQEIKALSLEVIADGSISLRARLMSRYRLVRIMVDRQLIAGIYDADDILLASKDLCDPESISILGQTIGSILLHAKSQLSILDQIEQEDTKLLERLNYGK